MLEEKHKVPLGRMFGLRLGSEAVGQLGFVGQMFGENLRVSLLGPALPLATGIASVTLDRAFFILSGGLVSVTGLIVLLIVFPMSRSLSLYAALLTTAFVALIFAAIVALRRRWPICSGPAQVVGRIRYFQGWIERERSLIQEIEDKLLDFYHQTPGAFWASLALNLATHGAAILEVYLTLRLMGARISPVTPLAVEALTKLVNVAGAFNPGNVGTYEGGNMLIAKMFGLTAAAGLTLGLARRVRAIFWAAIGGLCLVTLSKPKTRSSSAQPQTQGGGGSHIAVILANDLVRGTLSSTLSCVGSVPILLRAILGAQKAGARRIVIILDKEAKSSLVRHLQSTQRLPACVEWFELETVGTSFTSLLGPIIGIGDSTVALMSGDTTYNPSLHRRVAEWNGVGDALALRTGTAPVGMYALSRTVAQDLANSQAAIRSLEEFDAYLASRYSVETEQVEGSKWQHVSNMQERLAAEQKLDSWLVKPTDGIFARMNRKVSIPISRQLIKFPITPNMVSLFTLGVSFMAGFYFALGGYWNCLIGAVLSVFASILDGSDGEVARLKLQESDFGCWLETVCDQLYYLMVFAGITVGLIRGSGARSYLVWGVMFLIGGILSFLITGLQRRRLTNGRPEQLLGIWQSQAERRRSNPFLYLGRHTEFIIRRCFLPYLILFFALFNITNVLLILAALGANVVWPIALFSYFNFSSSRQPVAAASTVSA